MTILVTGATGNVGTELTSHLLAHSADFKIMARKPDQIDPASGITAVHGHFDDPAMLRTALHGIDTLFLLNPTVADELTQAVTILNLAHEAGIRKLVYVSVLGTDNLGNTPHVAVKIGAERLIARHGFGATILRPTLFMQNDFGVKDLIHSAGFYPWPIGSKGVAAVDVRDVAEAAALALIRHDQAEKPLPSDTLTICGPDALTLDSAAEIWSTTLGRDVRPVGSDLDQFEQMTAGGGLPAWYAYDLREMFAGMQAHGQFEEGAVARLTEFLGRPPRSYAEFTAQAAEMWAA